MPHILNAFLVAGDLKNPTERWVGYTKETQSLVNEGGSDMEGN